MVSKALVVYNLEAAYYLEAISSGATASAKFRINADTAADCTLEYRYVNGKGNAVLILV